MKIIFQAKGRAKRGWGVDNRGRGGGMGGGLILKRGDFEPDIHLLIASGTDTGGGTSIDCGRK